MKMTYETPEIEVTTFSVEDIITSSGFGGGVELPDLPIDPGPHSASWWE